MIKLEKTEVSGWEAAIRGMRNPMNSWEKSDTYKENELDDYRVIVGENDHDLMMRLAKAGTEHAKFLRYINVTVDIVAPLYWYKEMDCYRIGVEHNSCSTMHKIHSKEFTMDDFSTEHLINQMGKCIKDEYDCCHCDDCDYKCETNVGEVCGANVDMNAPINTFIHECEWEDGYEIDGFHFMELIIHVLNQYREIYIDTKDRRYWWQMIQLLPSSYNQRRTYQFSYQALAAIYRQRKGHKLDEWQHFREWIESLPYSELITGGDKDD